MKRIPILIILALLLGGCYGRSIPKAGPVQQAVTGLVQNVSATKTCTKKNIEIPRITGNDDIVVHIGYTVSYNHSTLCPNWVAYELTDIEVLGTDKGKESFQWDPILKGHQPNREDYKNDDQWDKGHMAPKADMKWSQQAYEESFYLSNICPQNHSFNAGIWCSTEKLARRMASTFGNVYIVCGPIFTDRSYGVLGPSSIQIPDRFYKALLVPKGNGYSAIAFVLNNSPHNSTLRESSMTVDSLENIIGIDLFHNLDDSVESTTESKITYGDWNL